MKRKTVDVYQIKVFSKYIEDALWEIKSQQFLGNLNYPSTLDDDLIQIERSLTNSKHVIEDIIENMGNQKYQEGQ